MDNNLCQKINNLYEENPLLQDFNGYILIKEDDHILFQQNFGYSDYVQKKIADENTIYSLGSITKQFTALCVLQLAQRGKLSLNEPIGTYLPDFYNGRDIIIRDILNMISGIPEYWCKTEWHENPEGTSEDSYSFIKSLTDYNLPHKTFHYCNSNYIILGKLIEKLSAKSLTEYLNENIFTPLNMTRTFFLAPDPSDTNTAIGYKSPHVSKWEKNTAIITSFAGAGGVYSTAADLCKWDEALYTEKLLTRKFMPELFKPVISNYAMGWYIHGNKIFHGGDSPGFSARLTRIPDHKLLILLLCNFDGCRESNMGHYADIIDTLVQI
jgi:CubicO group peptidase (beta-lactamase class C family)